MFSNFPKSSFTIIDRFGVPKGEVAGIVGKDQILVEDVNAQIFIGDEMRRKIPNGSEETYEVIDPVFSNGLATIKPHFQIKVRKKGTYQPGTGGNYMINVSGNNARVNVHSVDKSTNTIADQRVFSDLRSIVNNDISDVRDRDELLAKIAGLEASISNKPNFLVAYQEFITSAANHMTLFAPLLPALSNMLG